MEVYILLSSKNQKIKTIIFIIFASLTQAAFGIYIGLIVDSISGENIDIFIKRLIIVVVIIIFNFIFSVLARTNIYRNSCHKAEELKNKIYIKELGKKRDNSFDMANFTSKIDLIYAENFLNKWLIIEGICIFLFSAIAVISINWVMFLVSIAVSVIPMLIPGIMKGYVQNAAVEYSEGSTKYVNYINDTLQGRLEIFKYQVIEKFLDKHELVNKEFEFKRYKTRSANYKSSMTTGTIGNLTFVLVFLSGGILAFNDLISVGGVIGVIQLMNNIVNPIVSIASRKNEINACEPILSELNSDVKCEDKANVKLNSEDIKDMVLTAHNLVYSYPLTDVKVINGFSYEFKKGKKYLIQGDSGSGKTTLAKLLSGELNTKVGHVSICGENIQNIDCEQLSSIISYVDQKTYVFQDTIFNNIDMYRGFSEDKVIFEMDKLLIDNLELDKSINDTSGISGGQKSRVCLARAIMKLPSILIVDEPTSALDNKNTEVVIRYLCSLPATVIIISHHLDKGLVNLFDDIIRL